MRVAALAFFVLLAGCGGHGGSGSAGAGPGAGAGAGSGGGNGGTGTDGSSGTNDQSLDLASASGYWTGTLDKDGTAVNRVRCLVSSENEFGCLLFDVDQNDVVDGAAHGNISLSASAVTGTGSAFAAFGHTLIDGSTKGTFAITQGNVDSRQSLTLTLDMNGTVATLSANFDTLYDREASLARIAAAYSQYAIEGRPSSFSIDANGVVFAQSQVGCVVNGQVATIDPRYNEYAVNMTFSSCGDLNGDYSGLGMSYDSISMDDTFLFFVFNDTGGLAGAPLK
jgi:hypothetical protein